MQPLLARGVWPEHLLPEGKKPLGSTSLIVLLGPQEGRELEEISLCLGSQSEGPDCTQQGRAEGDC